MPNNRSIRRKNSNLHANQVLDNGNAEEFRDHFAKKLALLKPLFPLGDIIVTANAQRTLSKTEMAQALAKHATGDWSAMCEDDRYQNELALDQCRQIFSAFATAERAFWITSTADRSSTTILLPIDYWRQYESQSQH